jgi:hypothetical protein
MLSASLDPHGLNLIRCRFAAFAQLASLPQKMRSLIYQPTRRFHYGASGTLRIGTAIAFKGIVQTDCQIRAELFKTHK